MIYVTRLNHSSMFLNSDLIESIEATPDTVITLSTGQNLTVLESSEDLVEKIRIWRRSLLLPDSLVVDEMERSKRSGMAPVFAG